MRPFLTGKQSRTNDPERLRCIAWKHKDFDNQMATFHTFCAKLDLNLDHHTESAWKLDPKAQSTQMNEFHF
jgi:hypothetical protein